MITPTISLGSGDVLLRRRGVGVQALVPAIARLVAAHEDTGQLHGNCSQVRPAPAERHV